MATIAEHLRMLRDVEGVHGSFVVAMSGSLVDRDLPAVFDDELFAHVGPRISRLYEALVSGGKEMDACMLRYAEHKLYLRRMNWGLVGILAAASVNLPALRMVVNLVIRRIDPEIAPGSTQRPTISSLPRLSPPAPLRAPSGPLAAPHQPAMPPSPSPVVSRVANVVPEDGRDQTVPGTEQHAAMHVQMYRGRPVTD